MLVIKKKFVDCYCYVVELTNSDSSQPLLVFYFKKADDNVAQIESLGYSQLILARLKSKLQPLFIMPCTMNKVELYRNKKLAVINIYKGTATANLFHAVKYAIENFTFPSHSFCFQPIKGTTFKKLLKENVYLGYD